MKYLLTMLLIGLCAAANAGEWIVIELHRESGPGGISRVLVVAPNDSQTRRKIRQGHPWSVGLNTTGYTHATGAIEVHDNGVRRVFLVDDESCGRIAAKYPHAVILVAPNKER